MPLPDLLSVPDIHQRLQAIFPEGSPNRANCTWEIAAKTVFVMLYVGAVEGNDIWLRPDQVTRMTDVQAARGGEADRQSWAGESLKSSKGEIAGRWYAVNTRESIRDDTIRAGFIANGVVVERQGLATTSPAPRYALRDGATLDDVAERLGVSKAALYRYVQSKQDLLYACHEEAMEIARESIDKGEAEGRNGLEKIQIGMANYLREMIGAMGVPVLILEENALTGHQAAHIIALRDGFEKRMRQLVEEGVADGSILPVDPKLAIFMLLGAVHWVIKWYSPEGPWTADDVSDALIEMATRGFAAHPSEKLRAGIHN